MKIIVKTICLFLISASICLSATPLRWAFEASRPAQQTWEIYHGESVSLEPTILEEGTPSSYPTNSVATLYYQTNNMGSVWYAAPASIISNNVVAEWTPSLDCGAATYRFFISVVAPGGSISYRANGKLTMMDSPGAIPNELEIPVKTIDFSKIDIVNAPWAEASDVEVIGQSITALSNRVESIVANGGGIVEESDPHALPIAVQALVAATNAQATAAIKVPLTRTVNGRSLATNITLSAADIGAVPIDPADGWAKSEQGYRSGSSMMGFGYLTPNSLTLHSFAGEIKIDEDGISQVDGFRVWWPTATDGSPLAVQSDIGAALGDTVTIAHSALQPSWAGTGTVARSTMSDRIISTDGKAWIYVVDGTGVLGKVVGDYDLIVVATNSFNHEYSGPSIGTVFSFTGIWTWGSLSWGLSDSAWRCSDYGDWWYNPNDPSPILGSIGTVATLTRTTSESEYQSFSVAWATHTNQVAVATADDIAQLANTNWVNSIKGVFRDIATNVTYGLVVSNGHWLVKEIQ